ncbi:MAG: hypothetical protein QME74_02670 [Candidatus Edwardsbacteria bacterium]|nr:hypothetical protein [Candidatus Edwardsbacteria bacterium]
MMTNCGAGLLYWAFFAIVLIVCLVWLFVSIRFFSKATEYYQAELNDRQTKKEQMNELLAKMDQMVDVLKVK